MTNVSGNSQEIEVEVPGGQVEVINYDALVITTGATYVNPWRGDDDKMQTLDERKDEVKGIREQLTAAKSVLCIGAGATGMESAAWIKQAYPDKEVAIC